MIDILNMQVSAQMPAEEKRNRIREFLQIMALKIISDKGWFSHIAFTGGTALRILHDIGRFSEDLDFSLVEPAGYDFTKLCDQLRKEFGLSGLAVEGSPKADKTVHHVFLKFPGILGELGISGHRTQKLAIKIEIDTNPPDGGVLEKTLINKTYVFSVAHFDLPSMFATKLCACFYRNYIKGRDFYDLIWYLGKHTKPNYALLNNAIQQVTGAAPGLSAANIKGFLLEKVNALDFARIAKDVEQFLEDRSQLKLFDKQLITGAIEAVFA